MKPMRITRALRTLDHALTLNESKAWAQAGAVLSVRLTKDELASMALVSLRGMDPEDRELVTRAAKAKRRVCHHVILRGDPGGYSTYLEGDEAPLLSNTKHPVALSALTLVRQGRAQPTDLLKYRHWDELQSSSRAQPIISLMRRALRIETAQAIMKEQNVE